MLSWNLNSAVERGQANKIVFTDACPDYVDLHSTSHMLLVSLLFSLRFAGVGWLLNRVCIEPSHTWSDCGKRVHLIQCDPVRRELTSPEQLAEIRQASGFQVSVSALFLFQFSHAGFSRHVYKNKRYLLSWPSEMWPQIINDPPQLCEARGGQAVNVSFGHVSTIYFFSRFWENWTNLTQLPAPMDGLLSFVVTLPGDVPVEF